MESSREVSKLPEHSISPSVHPRQRPVGGTEEEQQIKSKVYWLTKLFFLKHRTHAADSWGSAFTHIGTATESAAIHRRKIIQDAQVSSEIIGFKDVVDAERAAALAYQQKILPQSQQAQQVLLTHLTEAQREKIDTAYKCAEIGFSIANDVMTTHGEIMDSEVLQTSSAFQTALIHYKADHPRHNTAEAESDFIHWTILAINCYKLDSESTKLAHINLAVENVQNQINTFKGEKEDLKVLKNNLATLERLQRDKKKQILSIKKSIAPGTLRLAASYGGKIVYGLRTILKQGSAALKNVELFAKGLKAIKGIVAADEIAYLTTSLIELFSHSSNVRKIQGQLAEIEKYEKKLEESEAQKSLNQEANILFGVTLAMKKKHLERSSKISKTGVALNIVSSISRILTLGKVGVAFYAILTATVLTIPGLNIAAIIVALLSGSALLANSLYHLHRDKAGFKLDVQLAEQSAQLAGAAGAFELASIKYQAIQKELHSVIRMEEELKTSIENVKKSLKAKLQQLDEKHTANFLEGNAETEETESYENIEEFYKTIETEIDKELQLIETKKMELQKEYEARHEMLYKMSLDIDKIIVRKEELKAARHIESLTQEFTRDIQKEGILEHHALFDDMLQHPETQQALVDLLIDEGIPVTKGHTFASILQFIRDDDAMPKSTKQAATKTAKGIGTTKPATA